MSRVGSTITESDSKILSGLFNPYQWYTPTVKPLPKFDDLVKLGVGGKLQQGQVQQPQQEQMQQYQQQKLQQMQPQQEQMQQYQQPLQQQMQPQQEQMQQYQQPLQQQMQPQQYQQLQQSPIQQQQLQPQQQKIQQEQMQQYQQQQLQQQMQPQQYQAQPIQQTIVEQPQGFVQFTEVPLGLQLSELPGTVYFEISEFEKKGKKGYEQQKHKGKRIPISEYEGSRLVSIQQGNFSDWQMEARNCIDKILQLNNKGYNRINQLENFKFNQGFSNQTEVNNWISRLKRNLDTLVKENERLRAELDSGNFGKIGGVQGGVMQGGVNLGKTYSESVDSSSVIRPSEIKKTHYSSEKIGQWHPQEKQSFTERVKDTAMGIATTVENVALHPIDSVGKLATTVEQVALHPIQSVEKAADAVVHTVM